MPPRLSIITPCLNAATTIRDTIESKSIKGSKVLILGISYKKNVDDMRESPSVEFMEILEEKGALVSYSDPHIPVFPKMSEHSFDLQSVELTADSLASYDAVLLANDHDRFDYELISKNAALVIDTRGKFQKHSNIIKA